MTGGGRPEGSPSRIPSRKKREKKTPATPRRYIVRRYYACRRLCVKISVTISNLSVATELFWPCMYRIVEPSSFFFFPFSFFRYHVVPRNPTSRSPRAPVYTAIVDPGNRKKTSSSFHPHHQHHQRFVNIALTPRRESIIRGYKRPLTIKPCSLFRFEFV